LAPHYLLVKLVNAAVLALDFEILPVAGVHAEQCRQLAATSRRSVRSPDIAQAYLEGMVLGTQDWRMRPYGVVTLGLD
jgi:PIN domain nuclease of toxin-antitoxin system